MSSLKLYSYLVQWKHGMKRCCKSLKKVKKKKKTNKQNIKKQVKKADKFNMQHQLCSMDK